MPEELKHDGPYADLTREVIRAAISVQKALGPGLLESAYEACLAHELSLAGHQVERQVPLGLTYRGLEVPQAFRMDLVVDGKVLIELKVVDVFAPEHEAQVLSYLRFSGLTVGLLVNFKSIPLTKSGLRRFVMSGDNSFSSASSA
ncbi:MAG TPA: GxxExxY protein [Holophagaceae bacterium]|nr:GxxExxY protein [Holophagaceae bacterium]